MSTPSCPHDVSVADACALVKERPDQCLIIDVREPFELEICRLPGADCVPMGQIPSLLTTLPRDRHLLILCHHGSRSRRVAMFLRAQGFSQVSNIAGGIDAWSREVDPSVPRY
ncbi:MAG: sulfurtransferase [Verrucomicrobia bacterium]|nr:sulfurtransferase [Verrucomicrobiota bacterium]